MGYEGEKTDVYTVYKYTPIYTHVRMYIEPKIPRIGSWDMSETASKTRNTWPFKSAKS